VSGIPGYNSSLDEYFDAFAVCSLQKLNNTRVTADVHDKKTVTNENEIFSLTKTVITTNNNKKI